MLCSRRLYSMQLLDSESWTGHAKYDKLFIWEIGLFYVMVEIPSWVVVFLCFWLQSMAEVAA